MANLLHIKGSRTKVLNTFPTRNVGIEGGIIISRIKGKGVYLCSKAGGTWYTANKLEELRNHEKNSITDLLLDKLTLPKLVDANKNTDKFLVSDSGIIKYRTGDEVFDDLGIPINNINYKTAYCSLGQYSDKETCEINGGTWYYSENDSHDSISSTAENQLLTVSQSIGKLDAESTLTYDGSVLQIKKNSDYDDNWQSSVQEAQLRFNDGTYYTGFKTHSTMTANSLYTLPAAYPGGDRVLQSDTSGKLSWVSDVGAVTAINGATENELVTVGATTTELDSENNLTYSSNQLYFGADSRIGPKRVTLAPGYDLDVHAGDAGAGSNIAGGDLYLNAGKPTGAGTSGAIYFTLSQSGAAGSTLRSESTVGTLYENGTFILTDSDGTAGQFKALNTSTSAYGYLTDTGVFTSGNLSLDADGGNIFLADDETKFGQFESSGSVFKLFENGGATTGDYFKIDCATNGASTISTVDAFAMGANLTIDPDGQLILNGAGIPNAIKCEDPLFLKEKADANTDILAYGQLWVHDDTPNTLWFTDDAGSDYQVAPMSWTVNGADPIYGRMSSVNTWYVGNQSFGTSITAADWTTFKFNYAQFTAITPVVLNSWYFVGEFSSSVDWEIELWDVTIPSNGTAAPSTAAKVGSTQSVSATAYAIYTIGETGLEYTLDTGHQLYYVVRYTSGSGTKYTYGTATMEFSQKNA